MVKVTQKRTLEEKKAKEHADMVLINSKEAGGEA